MKYCKKCAVSVRDNSRICPLCQHSLTDIGGESESVFPYVPLKYTYKDLYIKMGILSAIIICVISVTVDLIVKTGTHWSLYVLGGAVSLGVVFAVVMPKLRNIPKAILHQAVTCGIIVYIWDICTGNIGWSFDYVIPFLCAGTNIAMIAVFFALKLKIDDVAFYYFMSLIIGLMPIWFILSGIAGVIYPSLTSIGVSVISLAAFILFYGPNIIEMLKSKFHI